MQPTLATLADDLASGRTTARALVEDCIARIDDPDGEGGRAFVRVNREAARAAAEAQDLLRKAGAAPSPFAGIPIGIKDLFDVAGEVTAAGSRVLRDSPPAKVDAPAVARLRRAGFVLVGRNTMTEFAYSGLGMNPHTGNPSAPFERATSPRVSGGSSSGGAVAVADGMAHAALGTDTGGSCRIPAAFCGLVGFKPTARRVPREGAFPLSTTLDSIGPIARSVACCAALDAILSSGEAPLPGRSVAGLRLLVPTTVALDGLDAPVAAAFETALDRLAKAGANIVSAPFPEFGEIATLNAKGGFAAAESYAVHRRLLAEKGDAYDPRVSVRVRRGAEQSAADYVELVAARAGLVARAAARLAGFDALALPTVAIAPPRIADLLTDDDAYGRANIMALRNPTLINMIDGCAISLPLTGEGGLPAGLMLAGAPGTDAALFAVAAGVEAALKD